MAESFLQRHNHRLKKNSITLEDLEQKCAHSHAVRIARDLSEWRTTRAYLEISEAEMKEIEANYKNDEAAMKVGLLETWLKKCGDEATYLKLFEALDSTNRVDLIDECLRLIEEGELIVYKLCPQTLHCPDKKKQDEGVDSDSSDTLKDEDMRFLCGCGQCSLNSFLENGCPNPWEHAHFPLLNIKKMRRREKLKLLSRLTEDARDISEKFALLTTSVYRSLKKLDDFDIHELKIFLMAQQKFFYLSEEKRIKLQSDLSSASNVETVVMFLLTENYISWFNYPLLHSIAKKFKVCENEYLEYVNNQLTPFLRRSLFEIPSDSCNISDDPQGSGHFVLKIDVPNPDDSLKDSLKADVLLHLRSHVSSSLGIAIDAFDFCSYGKGCIQFVFAAPLGLLLKIFPLPDRVLIALSTLSYKDLFIKTIQFDHQIQTVPKKEVTNDESVVTVESTKLTDVFTMFASLIVELYKCIKENNIELQRVKEFLFHLNSRRLRITEDKPLLHKAISQVDKLFTLSDLFLFLNQFWSFYNFKLLEKLFIKFDSYKAKPQLKEYILSLEALKVVEMPPLIQPFYNVDCYQSDLLELRLCPNSLCGLSAGDLLQIHGRVMTVLSIEHYALLLKEVKIDEDKLEYLVPECVQFDPDMMASLPLSSLREEKIIGISFKAFNSDCSNNVLSDSEDSGVESFDTSSVASFESDRESHSSKKHSGGKKKKKQKVGDDVKESQSKGFFRMVDMPPQFLQPYQFPFGAPHSPPFVSPTSSYPPYDATIYPPSGVSPYISPPYAVNPSSLPPNPYLYFPGIHMSSNMPLSSSSNPFLPAMASCGVNMDVPTMQGSAPQVYQKPGMMPHFMSQDLPSQPPQISHQIKYPVHVKDQNKTPPVIPPPHAMSQNLLTPAISQDISQSRSSDDWVGHSTSTVITDQQGSSCEQQDEWPDITKFTASSSKKSLNEEKETKQPSSPKNETLVKKSSIQLQQSSGNKKIALQTTDYKGREMWKIKFTERLKKTELLEENIAVELTSSSYRDKFYYLLCFEESEHICLLSEKCDGDYKLFLKGYEMIEGGHYYVGYIYGMSHDQIQYATQASEAMFIIDREKNEDICRAEILPANFGNVNKKFLIALPSSSIKYLKRKLGITEGQSCQVSVQFEVKHSYFDTLHKAVVNIPQTMINKLFPTKEDISKPLQMATSSVNSKCFRKALSVDEYGQFKALELILQNPPNLPIILSGPFGSGKTRVLARATYEFVTGGLSQKYRTRILICAHHNNTVETYVNYLGPAFDGIRAIKIIKLMRKDSYGTSNIIHRSVRGFREDVRNGYYVSDHVLVIITTYTTSLHVADAIRSYNFRFTHILLDEVAQVREPEAIGALCLGTSKTKIVIAGDSKQVGPSVVVLGEVARENGLKMSLLERLEKRYDEIGCSVLFPLIQLDINYRCHPTITTLLSNVVYKYQIQSGLPPSKGHIEANNCPCVFYCSDVTKDPSTLDPSHSMHIEADAVVNQVKKFFSTGKWPNSWKDFTLRDVCVMSSFRTQLNIIRKRLKDSIFRHVTLLPSYAIQGHEFQAIVLSTYEPLEDNGESSNPTKTLVDPNIFNTAISRSRQLVIAVGNPFILLRTEKVMGYSGGCWREYIKLCLEKNTMFFPPNLQPRLHQLKELLRVQVGISSTVKAPIVSQPRFPPQRSQTSPATSEVATYPPLQTSHSYPSAKRTSGQPELPADGKRKESIVPKKSGTTRQKPSDSTGQLSSEQPVFNKSIPSSSSKTISGKSGLLPTPRQLSSELSKPTQSTIQKPKPLDTSNASESGLLAFSAHQVSGISPAPFSVRKPMPEMLVYQPSPSEVTVPESTWTDFLLQRHSKEKQQTQSCIKTKDEKETLVSSYSAIKSKRKKKGKSSQLKHTFTYDSISSAWPQPHGMSVPDEPPVKESVWTSRQEQTFADIVKQSAPKKPATKRQ